ncbi:MAG: dual specificity protein phosphatase family protein, partial [Rhabdochlamydiaceae bacterium]
LINPVDISSEARDLILKHHDIDGLKYLMEQLRKLMDNTCSTDFVIYIHCAAGKDRTGEASACYLMQYKNYSYHDAIALDQKIAGRGLKALSMNAIRWYAFYLRDILHFSTIGKIDGQ